MPKKSISAADLELNAHEEATARGRRSETWLTKSLAYMLAADERTAGSFAQTVVRALDPQCDLPPPRLLARPEERFYAGLARQRERRADLFLWSADGMYALLVEAKLGAACSFKQIPDYVRLRPKDLGGLAGGARIYVALLASRSLALPPV